MKFNELEVVRLLKDFPEHGVYRGEVGAIILTFAYPREAYEVEFINSDGSTKAEFTILPEDLEHNLPLVHDWHVIFYKVDFSAQVLIIHCKSEKNVHWEIEFAELLAHQFENVIQCNILLDIEQHPTDSCAHSSIDYLSDSLKFAFPISSKSVEDLKLYLQKEKYNIFTIYSSLGLNGTVIAKSITFRKCEQ